MQRFRKRHADSAQDGTGLKRPCSRIFLDRARDDRCRKIVVELGAARTVGMTYGRGRSRFRRRLDITLRVAQLIIMFDVVVWIVVFLAVLHFGWAFIR